MDASANSATDLAALRGDLAALKSDVASLIEHLKIDAKSGARNAADQFTGGVRELSRTATDGGQQSVKAVGGWVDQQPVLAFLIAVGVGYVGARALSR